MSFVLAASPQKPANRLPSLVTLRDGFVGVAFYACSTFVVFVAVFFGVEFLKSIYKSDDLMFFDAVARWDAMHYRHIVSQGYAWDPESSSRVAFFPAYPVAITLAMKLFPWRIEVVQVIVAHFFLMLSFILLHAYARHRFSDRNVIGSILLVYSIYPTTFFFRMGYAEPMLVCAILGLLLGVERRWPLWILALIAGLGTATRPPGVALIPVVMWETYRRRDPTKPRSLGTIVANVMAYALLASWGIIAYMIYQQIQFGNPLAFVQTQKHWSFVEGDAIAVVRALLILEPIWGTYFVEARSWDRIDFQPWMLFSLFAWNPIFFVAAVVATIWGGWKKQLTTNEVLLAAGLILIPYLTKGFPQSMTSFGRFTSVVVPVYLWFGSTIARVPRAMVGIIVALMTLLLVLFSAMFAAGFALV